MYADLNSFQNQIFFYYIHHRLYTPYAQTCLVLYNYHKQHRAPFALSQCQRKKKQGGANKKIKICHRNSVDIHTMGNSPIPLYTGIQQNHFKLFHHLKNGNFFFGINIEPYSPLEKHHVLRQMMLFVSSCRLNEPDPERKGRLYPLRSTCSREHASGTVSLSLDRHRIGT